MGKLFYLTLGFVLAVIAFNLLNMAYGEEYTIEMSTEYGFNPNNGTMTINQGDTITFTLDPNYIDEHHDIFDPWGGGYYHLAEEDPIKSYVFNDCTSYTFDSTWYILDEVVNVDVINCPEPEVVVPTNSTSTNIEPEVTEEFTPDNPPDNSCGFTGWQQEGNRNVAYRCGEEVASYIIDNPRDNFVGNTQTEQQQTLDLRLQILKILESIFKILFG